MTDRELRNRLNTFLESAGINHKVLTVFPIEVLLLIYKELCIEEAGNVIRTKEIDELYKTVQVLQETIEQEPPAPAKDYEKELYLIAVGTLTGARDPSKEVDEFREYFSESKGFTVVDSTGPAIICSKCPNAATVFILDDKFGLCMACDAEGGS